MEHKFVYVKEFAKDPIGVLQTKLIEKIRDNSDIASNLLYNIRDMIGKENAIKLFEYTLDGGMGDLESVIKQFSKASKDFIIVDSQDSNKLLALNGEFIDSKNIPADEVYHCNNIKGAESVAKKVGGKVRQFSTLVSDSTRDKFESTCRQIASSFGYPRANCNGLAIAFGNESKRVSILYETTSSSAGILVTVTIVKDGKSVKYSGIPLNSKNLLSIIKE